LRRLGTSPGDGRWNPRWDLKPGPLVPTGPHVTIQDIAVTVTGPTGYPPMLDGEKALNQTCPLAP
jgi:hypothetical protein